MDMFYLGSHDVPVSGGESSVRTMALFMHGWGSDERDLAALSEYLPAGLPWMSLRAPERHPSFGYAWFQLPTLESFDDDAIARAVQTVWSFLDDALEPGVSLVPVGFSQGGLMASELLRTRPDRVAGAVILSGFVSSTPHPGDEELRSLKPPVMWGRGDSDMVIPGHAIEATELFLPDHSDLEKHVYAGVGHSVTHEELVHMRRFITRVVEGL